MAKRKHKKKTRAARKRAAKLERAKRVTIAPITVQSVDPDRYTAGMVAELRALLDRQRESAAAVYFTTRHPRFISMRDMHHPLDDAHVWAAMYQQQPVPATNVISPAVYAQLQRFLGDLDDADARGVVHPFDASRAPRDQRCGVEQLARGIRSVQRATGVHMQDVQIALAKLADSLDRSMNTSDIERTLRELHGERVVMNLAPRRAMTIGAELHNAFAGIARSVLG